MGSSGAIKDKSSFSVKEVRLPWSLRIVFAAGIIIPVCMIIHSSDIELRSMEQSLKQEEKARISVSGERDMLTKVVEQSAARAEELSGKLEVITGSKRAIEQRLEESGKWLNDERRIRSSLQERVSSLSGKMTDYQNREDALQDIIELLEGEVASVEKRLQKIKSQENVTRVAPNVAGVGEFIASRGPKSFNGPEHHGSHDAPVIALLNEIGVMNREIEEVREERNMLKAELERLAAGKDESNVALRRSRKESRGRFFGFGKDDNE